VTSVGGSGLTTGTSLRWSIILGCRGGLGIVGSWLSIESCIVIAGGSGGRFGGSGLGGSVSGQGGCDACWVGSAASLSGHAELRAVGIVLPAVVDAVLDLVCTQEVGNGLRVLSGIWDRVVGADALELKGIGVAIVRETASGLLIKAEERARRDLVPTPYRLGSKIDILRVDRVVCLGGNNAQERGQGDGDDGSREVHLEILFVFHVYYP
jgi:hypothetical protein